MFSSADTLAAPPITDPTVEGAHRLFLNVICQAIADHGSPSWRHDVDAFFAGPAFAGYCALLGWNHDWARRRIQGFVGTRRPAASAVEMRRSQYEF